MLITFASALRETAQRVMKRGEESGNDVVGEEFERRTLTSRAPLGIKLGLGLRFRRRYRPERFFYVVEVVQDYEQISKERELNRKGREVR